MILLRLYLLSGLVVHKAVWEVLKRRQSERDTSSTADSSAIATLLKSVKIVILAALVLQIMLPPIFPIAESPRALRAIGTVLYTIGLIVALLGRWRLGTNWSDIERSAILRQHQVVSTGVYRYIRHPIYTGDLLLIFGLELALNSWLILGACLIAPYAVWRALREERMLVDALPGYQEYCGHTYRFLPFLM